MVLQDDIQNVVMMMMKLQAGEHFMKRPNYFPPTLLSISQYVPRESIYLNIICLFFLF